MTADIRTAAQWEAERRWPDSFVGQIAAKHDFVAGAVWGAARVTPTREQLVDTLDTVAEPWDGIDLYKGADAILALLAGLAEGES